MIKISKCNHIRIRNDNAYEVDVEKIIKDIEMRYDIDFRSLPRWREIMNRLYVTITDYNLKIQNAKYRKVLIINKLFQEFTRVSPFDLTEKLSRTAKRWHMLDMHRKKTKIVAKVKPEIIFDLIQEPEAILEKENDLTTYPNTEKVPSQALIPSAKEKLEPKFMKKPMSELSHLPIYICVNQHKLVPPLSSKYGTLLSHNTIPGLIAMEKMNEEKEWLLLSQTLCIKSHPQKIIIVSDSLDKQVVKFSLENIFKEYLTVKFVRVTEKSPFRWAKISPMIPCKLYPGIQVVFKFTYELSQNVNDFQSSLFFRVRDKARSHGSQLKSFCIPIKSIFNGNRSVFVSETIFVPSAYQWNLKKEYGYPAGNVKISIKDDFIYELRIFKRMSHFAEESQECSISAIPLTPNTESLLERIDEVEAESKSFAQTTSDKITARIEFVKTTDIVSLIVSDVIELVLESFLFEKTYLSLKPHSELNVPVYLTKAERIGSHHSYYDFVFTEPNSSEILFTKTVKIFAEVLPHPIKISPKILDMSNSPITYGFCEDYIVISNTHKVYPVSINIHSTKKMRKLFCITPKTTSIPANSDVKLVVRFCSSTLSLNKSQNLVHFTIKMCVSGYKPIYGNAPPFFYEIIAPCKLEYLKVYKNQYFEKLTNQ